MMIPLSPIMSMQPSCAMLNLRKLSTPKFSARRPCRVQSGAEKKTMLLFERNLNKSGVVLSLHGDERVLVRYMGRVEVPNEGPRAKVSITAPKGTLLNIGTTTHASDGKPKEYLLFPFNRAVDRSEAMLPVTIGSGANPPQVWLYRFKGANSAKAILAFRGPADIPIHRQELVKNYK